MTEQGEAKWQVTTYEGGRWHRIFLIANKNSWADCHCEDGNHYPRDWSWPPDLNDLEQQVAALKAERDARGLLPNQYHARIEAHEAALQVIAAGSSYRARKIAREALQEANER